MTTIGMIRAVALAVTALAGVFFWVAWKMKKSTDQKNQDIDQQIQQDKEKAKETGRPE